MLDILSNLDTVNYIVQDCLSNCTSEMKSRNTYYVGEGYGMDVTLQASNRMDLRVRTSALQTLCRVMYAKNMFILRYTPDFFLKYNIKTDTITCNLFEEPFSLSEMESTFFMQSTIGIGLVTDADFSFDTMSETIQLARSVYHCAYLSTVQAKN